LQKDTTVMHGILDPLLLNHCVLVKEDRFLLIGWARTQARSDASIAQRERERERQRAKCPARLFAKVNCNRCLGNS
jgi:hypothetical protein